MLSVWSQHPGRQHESPWRFSAKDEWGTVNNGQRRLWEYGGGQRRHRRTGSPTHLYYPSMIGSCFGIFLQVIVKLSKFQVDNSLFWVGANESASETFNRFSQS